MPNKSGLPTGAEITEMVKATFGTDRPTPEQLRYVMTMLQPSMYVSDHHRVKGHRFTFSVPGRNAEHAQSHRPWQRAIIDDMSPDKAVMKSRQLGLKLSSLA